MDIEFTIPIYIFIPLVVLSVIAWVLALKWRYRQFLKEMEGAYLLRADALDRLRID